MKYGVDIEAGDAFVEKLKEKAPTIGGFGGMFKVPCGYEEPILVSGTDGVGTKINLCRISSDPFAYQKIGQDLVAMCVNDIITCGAKPLYFLDYISTQKIDDNLADIMVGILKGCEISEMELIGGETAEHTDQSEYDLAGFCTGIVEKNELIDGSLIQAGDKIIGIESSGLHSNGFTLINEMLWRHKIALSNTPELLTPTTIYAPFIMKLLEEFPIVGMAHITGGGLLSNVSRCIPKGLKAEIDYSSWKRPEIFNKIQQTGEIEEDEMRRVFNIGIGYCLIVPDEVVSDIQDAIHSPTVRFPHIDKSWVIGEITHI